MRWNATEYGVQRMNEWAEGGDSPFDSKDYKRLFYFPENKDLWEPGSPQKTIPELWEWVAKDLGITI